MLESGTLLFNIIILVTLLPSRYFNDNMDAGIFANADAAYVLAYATIMLATDLHNPGAPTSLSVSKY